VEMRGKEVVQVCRRLSVRVRVKSVGRACTLTVSLEFGADGTGASARNNAPPSPVKSDLTYADPPPKPARPTPAKVTGGSPRTPTAATKEPQDGDVTLSALVAADRSASTSSSFSRDYVERWRSTVELSEDDLSFDTDVRLDDTSKSAAALPSQSGGSTADPGSTPTLKRTQPGPHLEGGTSSQRGTLSGARRLATHAGSTLEIADQNKPPKAASSQLSKRANKFGRDVTNGQSTETSDPSESR
jgi:hypothetical protein